MRPHGSSLVGGSGSIFSGASAAGTGSSSGFGIQNNIDTASGSSAGPSNIGVGSGNLAATGIGSGGGFVIGSEPTQRTRRVGLSRRRQPSSRTSRPSSSLQLGGGFRLDLTSSFFQGRSNGIGNNTTGIGTSTTGIGTSSAGVGNNTTGIGTASAGIGSSAFQQGESSVHDGSSGLGFHLNGEASGSGFGGGDGGSRVGYRGVGYNPNFENADEYPTSQQHVQPPQSGIDLNVLANVRTRRSYNTKEKRQIYSWILQRNGTAKKLKRGVSAAVAELAKCPRRVVTRIWKQGLTGDGINSVRCMRKMKCGKKKLPFDIDALEAIPPSERTTIRQLAENINMSKSTVFRRLKEKKIRRVTSEVKPSLTQDNIKARVLYCLQNIEPSTFHDTPTFKGGFNIVHIDEKWFFRIKKKQNVYLSHREEAPQRETKNKGHIQKIMFISAMARPRYDAEGNCIFDGKIGVWAYVEWVQAQKRSANRIFLSHQNCMREIIRKKGSIHYDVPHMKKQVLVSKLPIRLTIDKEYVDAAIEWLNTT
ncbi:hypothetical protein ACQ4PT_015172 [Festuca glaucescens]